MLAEILIILLVVFGPLLVFLWILGVIIFPAGDALDEIDAAMKLRRK